MNGDLTNLPHFGDRKRYLPLRRSPPTVDMQAATDALFFIPPPADRAAWISLGTAAKRAGVSFESFHAWSSAGPGYKNERECRSDWNAITAEGAITPGTLFGAARDAGWSMQFKPISIDLNRQRVEALRQQVAPEKPLLNVKASEMWSRCIPVSPGHEYIQRKRGFADGIREYPKDGPVLTIQGASVAGWLAVPCVADDLIQTIQFIPPSGKKLNLPGASFTSGYHVVGEIVEGKSIHLVEGIGQAWACYQATDEPAIVCFGAGRIRTVAGAVRTKYPNARLVIVPDRGKEEEASVIATMLDCTWCGMPQEKPANYDANDYAEEHGDAALRSLLRSVAPVPTRYKLLSATEMCDARPMQWMIKGLLPATGLASLFGPSGSGKSFLVLAMAAAVAGAFPQWFGRKVKQCPVTYCVLEGEAGINKRLKAWSIFYEKPLPDALRFVTQEFDLLKGADVPDLATAICRAGGQGGLIILDTLNRAAPGADENSSSEMGAIIASAKQLQQLTGGLVCLVHHTGKDATKGLRGHSSLYAALDGAISVHTGTTGPVWQVSKSKDDATGAINPFQLEIVVTGADEDGEEETSCVAISTAPAFALSQTKKLPLQQLVAKDVLWELLTVADGESIPAEPLRISRDDALSAVADKMDVDKKRKRERAKAAIEGLIKLGLLCEDVDDFWIHP